MHLPRFRLSTLMLAVAAVAVAIAGLDLTMRSASDTVRAESHRAQGSYADGAKRTPTAHPGG
jgi:hypothetical protein